VKRTLTPLITSLLLCLALAAITLAASNEDTLKKLKTQISQQEAELRSLESSRSSLARQVELSQKNQADIRQAIAITSRQIEDNRRRIAALNAEEKTLTRKSAQYQRQAQAALRFIVDNSGSLTARVVLGGTKAGESADSIATMELIAKLNNNLLAAVLSYGTAIKQIETVKADLASTNSALEENLSNNQTLSADLASTSTNLNKKLQLVKQDQKAQAEYVAKLKREQTRLTNLIKNNSVPMPNSNFAQSKGKLPYPMAGRITETFGNHMVPEAGVSVMHNGVKITPSGNGKVSAVFAGTVVYTDYITGLGNLLIIQHDSTYYTVYSQLDEFYVNVRQKVAAGEAIGAIDQSIAGRAQLYFEIRQRDKAVNPAQWLRK
jgi:septal ring factor EnvC (AmiA/AmiB activator)